MKRVRMAMGTALLALGLACSPARVVGQCCGDCNGDGVVAVNELVTAVNRALASCQDDDVCDASVATCAAQLGTCTTTLTSVQADLDACNTSLATCNAGTAVSGVPFHYAVEHPDLITVSSDGLVTAQARGITSVLVSGGGASARVPVRVGGLPATVTVTPANPEVLQGGTIGLIVDVRDAQGAVVPDAQIAFATSDPAIATVSPTGVVSGVAAGPATIVVTAVPAEAERRG